MSKNIVYYFTGTGNSLKVAKDIAEALGDCGVVSMGTGGKHDAGAVYESVGFVFPVYCSGPPHQVRRFVQQMDVSKSKEAYYFSVATCGGSSGNALAMIDKMLQEKAVRLHYGASHKMAANYVALYKMNANNKAVNDAADKELPKIVAEVKSKTQKTPPKEKLFGKLIYSLVMKNIAQKDKGFQVSDECVGCSLCKNICPVDNIDMVNKKPIFKHKCEQCMACIQWCPKQAVNYKNKTQNRGRYHHPSIKQQEIVQSNKK